MSQNVPQPSLSSKQRRAAVLVAEDELTDEAIAAEVGVTRRTLTRWKDLPEFIEAVDLHAAELERRMMRLAIARRRYRVQRLNDLEDKLWIVINERAEDKATKDVAGGGTGLIVRDVKMIGTGQNAVEVEVFGVDTGVIREIRSLHERAAKELGQDVDKLNVTGSIKREYLLITPDDAAVEDEP